MEDKRLTAGEGIADLRPLWRSKDQKAWYWYDWATYPQTLRSERFTLKG